MLQAEWPYYHVFRLVDVEHTSSSTVIEQKSQQQQQKQLQQQPQIIPVALASSSTATEQQQQQSYNSRLLPYESVSRSRKSDSPRKLVDLSTPSATQPSITVSY